VRAEESSLYFAEREVFGRSQLRGFATVVVFSFFVRNIIFAFDYLKICIIFAFDFKKNNCFEK